MQKRRWILAFGLPIAALLVWLAPVLAAPREQVITILHTNDMHGRVLDSAEYEPVGSGGLARVSTMIQRIRSERPNVLVLEAGDVCHGTPTELIFQGESMIRSMNTVGYDAATLGNHEFDWSQIVTSKHVERARFPFLAANVRDTNTDQVYGGAREYVILERGGVRFGIFGLTTMQTVQIEWPPFLRGVRFEDPTETARRLVPEIQKKADVVLFLSHLGYLEDKKIAAAVPGIDIIVGGHSHTTLNAHEKIGNTVIAHAGSYARALGRMDLRVQKSGSGWKIVSINGLGGQWWDGDHFPKQVILPAEASVPQDPRVVAVYNDFMRESSRILSERIAEAPATIPGQDARKGPQPLQPLMAGLLRQSVRADVALVDAGIGPELRAGPVTAGDIFALVGGYTRQNVIMVRATGRAIREAVEKSYSEPDKYPAYYAGLKGKVVRSSVGVRLENASIQGKPMDETATYTVAAPSYLIMDHPTLLESPLVSDRLGWQKPLFVSAARGRGLLEAGEPELVLPPPPPAPAPVAQ